MASAQRKREQKLKNLQISKMVSSDTDIGKRNSGSAAIDQLQNINH
jgi:hypothetical protein